MFAQTIEIWVIWKPGAEVQILGLKDDVGISCVKQDLVTTQDPEAKWFRLVIKAEDRSITVSA
jgi:hypothetical protein